ncbi:MAG: SDR family NAD(P)-dependent oxidoreductase [Saprospiraceae bacterium]|nr:SDR family NAD(P)-dependent oxidoreductase [Saprospiraceae bacterium]
MNVIITGASKGIGLAIAKKFALKGFDLALCSRSIEELEIVANQLKKEYSINVIYKAVDLSKKNEAIDFGNFVLNQWEKIDVLINNAGIYIGGEISNEEDGALEAMIQSNLYSAYYLTKTILPKLIENHKGHIINMCSIASKIAYPNGGSYSISKFALLGFSKVLREELKTKNIKVTSILPGATWSNSWAGVDLPKDRIMDAEDIAKVVWSCYDLADNVVVEDITIRPLLGDL